MNKVDLIVKVIKENDYFRFGNEVQTFNTRNIIGDTMTNIYDDNDIQIDVCYAYEYIEVFGLSESEYQELLKTDVCY